MGEKDFDEMLRAGVISPGSSPFVESRRAIEILSVPYKLKRVIKAVRRAVIPAAPPAPG